MQNKRFPYFTNRFFLYFSLLLISCIFCFDANAKEATKEQTPNLSQQLIDKVPFLINELLETTTNIGELRTLAIADPLNLTQNVLNLEDLKQAIQAQFTRQTIYLLQSPKIALTSLPIQTEDEDELTQVTLKNYVQQVQPLKIDFILFTNIIVNKQNKRSPVLLMALFNVKEATIQWRFYSSEQL